jgi:hypothetical protein
MDILNTRPSVTHEWRDVKYDKESPVFWHMEALWRDSVRHNFRILKFKLSREGMKMLRAAANIGPREVCQYRGIWVVPK